MLFILSFFYDASWEMPGEIPVDMQKHYIESHHSSKVLSVSAS